MRAPSTAELRDLVLRQVASLYPVSEREAARLEVAVPAALAACERSFSRIRNKYYAGADGAAVLDPLHGCQWAQFLYRLARALYLTGGGGSPCPLCDKVYALGKALSSADLFYQVELPEVFVFDHPLGAVMGRARYGNFFSFGQGCTVGNNHGSYPEFGESVFMLSDSKVVGDCRIGDFAIISANAFVKDEDIPSGSIVFGQSPHLVIKENRLEYVKNYAESVFRY